MRRIIVLTLIIAFISTLALAESQSAPLGQPKGYSMNIAGNKVVVVTPLDKSRSVLISFFDEKTGKPIETSSYMAEGIMALSAAQLTKLIAGKPDDSKLVNDFTKEMVKARRNALK